MSPLRLIDTGLSPARWNVAVTAALAERHAEGRLTDTFRLHRYPLSVLLGRSQPPTAVDRAACARRGAEIARRVTGGGAVAMGPGILAWDLVAGARWPSLETAATALGAAIVRALATVGIAATFSPPGDILVAGRKVAGTSGAFEAGTILHQGSLLVTADVAEMAALLGQPSLPVATLADIAPPPSLPALGAALAEAFAEALGQPLDPAPLDAGSRARAEALLSEEIGTDAFVFGDAEAVP